MDTYAHTDMDTLTHMPSDRPQFDGGSPVISYSVELREEAEGKIAQLPVLESVSVRLIQCVCLGDEVYVLSASLPTESWQSIATVPEPMAFAPAPPSPLPPLQHTVTRLTPGHRYRFRVCSRNSVGVRGGVPCCGHLWLALCLSILSTAHGHRCVSV